jgi:hypothetical protein
MITLAAPRSARRFAVAHRLTPCRGARHLVPLGIVPAAATFAARGH